MAIVPQVKSHIVRNKDLDQTNQVKTLSSIQIQFLRSYNPHIGRPDFITIHNHHSQSQTPNMSEVTAQIQCYEATFQELCAIIKHQEEQVDDLKAQLKAVTESGKRERWKLEPLMTTLSKVGRRQRPISPKLIRSCTLSQP
jgi:hypothetical protein